MAELILQTLPYQRDSHDLIHCIGALPGAVCLDSGLGQQPESRYDILTALPSKQLRLHKIDDANVIEQRQGAKACWQPLSDQSCIFTAADSLLQHDRPSDSVIAELSHLPFCGGVLACFGYDAAGNTPCRDERSDVDDCHELGEVLSQAPTASCGLYQWAVVVDHECGTTSLFVLPACPDVIRRQVMQTLCELNGPDGPGLHDKNPHDTDKHTDQDFILHGAFQPQLSADQYSAAFDRLKAYIVAGDCYQANLAIPFVGRFCGEPLQAYLRLRQGSRSPFSAFFDTGDAQVLSLSPERFVSVNEREVVTQPIKGTRKRSLDPKIDKQRSDELQNSEKDRAENLMIVDLLRNDLGSLCETGSVQTRELFKLHSFSQVHHLISTITGILPKGVSAFALLKRCFPGGSITGAPKIRAMQIIAELEPLPRSVYCGSVMYCDYRGRMDSSISIRTLLCYQGHIFCWGGGGIVSDSEMAREYQEAYDKVSALMALVSAQPDS